MCSTQQKTRGLTVKRPWFKFSLAAHQHQALWNLSLVQLPLFASVSPFIDFSASLLLTFHCAESFLPPHQCFQSLTLMEQKGASEMEGRVYPRALRAESMARKHSWTVHYFATASQLDESLCSGRCLLNTQILGSFTRAPTSGALGHPEVCNSDDF